MNTLKNININDKRVLIRVDFNVPIIDGQIKNYFRLKSSVNTINYCLSKNCSVVLMTHLGRPQNNFEEKYSVYPMLDFLENEFNVFVHYSEDCISDKAIKTSKNMLPKEIHLLENLRFYKEEENDDVSFSKKLAKHADVYINDAFGTSHRSHASNSSILKFYTNKCIGLLMEKELNYLSPNFINTSNKCTLIIGGAKISGKMKMLENFLEKSNNILIGGGMAFTFLKAKGFNIGKSLHEDSMIDFANNLLVSAAKYNVNVVLPVDVVCSNKISDEEKTKICTIDNIDNNDIALDIGPETTMMFEMFIENSKNILWNGPLGAFEYFNFATGTQSISSKIRKVSSNENITSIIGGGDTVSAIESSGTLDGFTHISTGGGASLRLLSNQVLNIKEAWDRYEK